MTLTEPALFDFLRDSLGVDTADLDAGSPLFSTGVIDSFSLVSLLTFVESRGGFRINPADVSLDNFDSVERIVAFSGRMSEGA